MSTTARQLKTSDARMERKPILMPPSLIKRIEKMAAEASRAEKRAVSFAEIVRRALETYDPNENKEQDDATLEALAGALVASNKATITQLRKLDKKLDATHAEIEKHKHVLEREGR